MSLINEYAEKIHDNIEGKEIKGILLDVIMKNNLKNRVDISNYYQYKYGISLFDEIKTKIKGDFGYCAAQLFLSPLDFCIHHLKLGLENKDLRAMEQLTSRTPEELKLIEDKYNKTTGKNLKDDIKKAFNGPVGNNLINLWDTKRTINPNPNKSDCENFANTLIQNKPKDWVENENIFKEIFIERSPEELILIARYYLKNSGKNLIDDDLRGYLKVPMKYLGDGEFYVLRAKGDSMIGAGIDDGDLVIIKKQEFAEEGRIAVVLIEDEITLKRIHLRNHDNKIELQPANKKYKPVILSDYLILGIAQRIIKDID